MRVAVNLDGVITSAGDDLAEPYYSFPVNWPASDLVGLQVITGLSGMHYLVQNSQVIGREDNSKTALPGGSSPSVPLVAAAVENYMVSHPVEGAIGPQGERGIQGLQGNLGPKGDPGTPGAKGDTGTQGPKGDTGSTGTQGVAGPQGGQGPAGPATMRLAVPQNVTLLLNIPQDVTFVWSSAFASSSYSYDVAVAPALVGKVTVAQKTKTASALTLTLTAALGVAGFVGAIAWA